MLFLSFIVRLTLAVGRFAVLVLPSYADPQDKATNPFSQGKKGAEGEERDSWKWFNTVNRVCSGVKKARLVFLFSSYVYPLDD